MGKDLCCPELSASWGEQHLSCPRLSTQTHKTGTPPLSRIWKGEAAKAEQRPRTEQCPSIWDPLPAMDSPLPFLLKKPECKLSSPELHGQLVGGLVNGFPGFSGSSQSPWSCRRVMAWWHQTDSCQPQKGGGIKAMLARGSVDIEMMCLTGSLSGWI